MKKRSVKSARSGGGGHGLEPVPSSSSRVVEPVEGSRVDGAIRESVLSNGVQVLTERIPGV
ncbi:MAG: hypothetical protein LJF04_11160, partial [Gemmatimonadetes bacterium]|nr:hypothetical protein [Gemmatimonadota bacterium]